MKTFNKWSITFILSMVFTVSACVDDIKFGNAFLEKAPGGSVTQDTVFNNAEYTRQFLTGIYSLQYYGLPFANSSAFPYPNNPYMGKFEVLSDAFHNNWANASIQVRYYGGTHTSGYGLRGDKFDFTYSNVWEAVRYCWLLLENIDNVPDMENVEKEQLKAEAKCLLAARYWDIFRHYGGLPLITSSFSGTDDSYDVPRATAEETVEFMIGLLDEAAAVLPWQVSVPANEAGRWTKAGAMGLKTSILLFAASPLFNDSEPYCTSFPQDAVTNLNVWYGSYKANYWDRCLTACQEFFTELNRNGIYYLQDAAGTRPEDYRLAFRKAYFTLTSPEILHSTRVTTYDSFGGSTYLWHSWQLPTQRINYNPTQEYVEMFPWADGTPFDWDKAEKDGTLDEMFIGKTHDPSESVELTRDPRLYETVQVNGLPRTLDWTSGNMSGNPYELWIGGYDAENNPSTESNRYATGYGLMKYFLGDDASRQDCQWSYLRLAEVYLNYAEALCQKDQLTAAIEQVNIVRSRVGLGGLAECNPDKNLTSDKNALLEEILRERACELGMEDCRFFDMIRYKMQDRFAAQLHMLKITRVDSEGKQWFGEDKDNGVAWPEFKYERNPISTPTRIWWTQGFDTKWYLSPFPLSELNKDYGLVQNPGW